MGDISLHFDRAQFACKGKDCCGGAAPISERLIEALECLHFIAWHKFADLPFEFIVNSGFRCLTHNREVGSEDTSQHPLGFAVDIEPEGITPIALSNLAKYVPDFADGGIGLYPGFVHLDVRRGVKARW
jgi:uncharacterized protein YcbK (DUF882 family)